MMPGKYIGRIVEIVYIDRSGKLSQHLIEIHSIRNGLIRSTCLQTGEPRTFKEDNVLAWTPIIESA